MDMVTSRPILKTVLKGHETEVTSFYPVRYPGFPQKKKKILDSGTKSSQQFITKPAPDGENGNMAPYFLLYKFDSGILRSDSNDLIMGYSEVIEMISIAPAPTMKASSKEQHAL